MEQLYNSSAGYLFGFACLFGALVSSFTPAIAFALTMLVLVVIVVLASKD